MDAAADAVSRQVIRFICSLIRFQVSVPLRGSGDESLGGEGSRFPKICVSVPLRGSGDERLTYEQQHRNRMFQSPCGEVVMKDLHPNKQAMIEKFQSPCGEVVMKV